MPFDLTGRTVLITGASSGIGAATARQCAAAGARLVLAARRTDRLATLADEIEANHAPTFGPQRAHTVALDVRDADAVEAALSALPAPFDALDVAVLNAGLSRGLDPIDRAAASDVDEMLATNVAGVLNVVRAVVPGMRARSRGHLVFLGSVAGREAYPGGAVYCASKAAVAMLAEVARRDLHGTGLRVTNVAPGMVETDFSAVRFRGDTARAAAVYADTAPLTADDVADAIVYALSRPPHVNVSEVLLMPTAQAAATLVHRTPRAADLR